ncbi:helix-turn-helix transcriptional regulator, partial [bacterium]|nr:helix-turn-helix transcriptional regulator [bacterium]
RVGSFTASWLRSIAQHPDRASQYVADASERWFQRGDSIVDDFLAALDCTPGRVPRLGMSERTLRRRITAATGGSPQFWVGLHRARLAGRTTVLTDDPIVDIAFAVGYSDQAHMTREMRRWFGTTPAAMRRGAASLGHLIIAPDAFASGVVPDR